MPSYRQLAFLLLCWGTFSGAASLAWGQASPAPIPSPPGLLLTSPPNNNLDTVAAGVRWTGDQPRTNGGSFTLDQLLDLAAQNNPTILQAQFQITASLAKAQQAGLYPNPTVTYTAENIGVEGTAGEWQGAELQQRFVTANKLQISRDKYLQRAKVAEHLAVAQQFRVCNDVRLYFAKTLAAQQILTLQKELLKTAEDNLVTTREQLNLGQANQVDLHKANAMLRREQLALLQAENRIRREFFQLCAFVGVDLPYQPLAGDLADNAELIDFDQAYQRILRESPQILASHSKLREDRITVSRESVEWVPDVIVGGGPGYNFESSDATAALNVMIELPIYDRNQGTIRQAQSDYVRQQNEIRRLEMKLRMTLAEQYEHYLSASQHVLTYEEIVVPELRAAYETSLKSYQANRAEWPNVLHVYHDFTQRRIELIEHLLQKRISEILIEGYLLQGGLDAASNPTPPGHIDATPNPR
ncbi:TolC family protein [Blastopirellula marina]|uniref:TolC family protein n=1 Tax=Blastopirellula marina TaxID=124 RepID=A0A2S8GSP4_9BACT|nr:TolC family protein [Blastopirellula marina]PQO36497.1 TolC family protein [Blastopirellula marina]PQO47448.1 TolC family protein [Blastopirellula marina]PTL44334.1 TolC family protein [Blastopirellula marina]